MVEQTRSAGRKGLCFGCPRVNEGKVLDGTSASAGGAHQFREICLLPILLLSCFCRGKQHRSVIESSNNFRNWFLNESSRGNCRCSPAREADDTLTYFTFFFFRLTTLDDGTLYACCAIVCGEPTMRGKKTIL